MQSGVSERGTRADGLTNVECTAAAQSFSQADIAAGTAATLVIQGDAQHSITCADDDLVFYRLVLERRGGSGARAARKALVIEVGSCATGHGAMKSRRARRATGETQPYIPTVRAR